VAKQTRDEKMIEQMNAPIELNVSVDIKIPRSNQVEDKKYKCTCCGKSWDNQKTHFSKTGSPLYQSNNGYLPICNECRDNYYYKLIDLYSGNEAHAIRHFCQQFDIIFQEDALTASRQISSDRSRISHYQAKKNLGQTARVGSTYTDGMKYAFENGQRNIISSKAQVKSGEVTVTASAVDRWRIGFTEAYYKNLDEHYRMLKKYNPNADNNQEIFIKSLCNLNMLMVRALQSSDSKEYSRLVEQYTKTFKQAGLKTIEEKDNSNNECVGVTLATISQFTPEEFYKDKKLFEDNDNIDDYYDRHIRRPMQNLKFDQDVRDIEYFVPEGESDDDD
jgi:transcription elongation factor Elf1